MNANIMKQKESAGADAQALTPPRPLIERQIRVSSDGEGVFVYQAFTPRIVEVALRNGTFGEGFGRSRMTWIKPSFGWMLYRSGYAEKNNQERILRIKITHEGFHTLLENAVTSDFKSSNAADHSQWQEAVQQSKVVIQWDPDRDLHLRKIQGQRAIQIGIGPQLVGDYVGKWIIGLEDVTNHAKRIAAEVVAGKDPRHPFPESVYEVPVHTAERLGMLCE